MSDVIEVKGQYYIRANASMADATTRVLKHADTFGIFDRHGDIRPHGFENHGVFHEGTRFVSRWKLGINDTSPLLLSSSVKEDNDFLVVDLTNPVLRLSDDRVIPHGVIHLVRTTFLWEGDFFERIEIRNFALEPVRLAVDLEFQADYVDLFEVRGTTRKDRGRLRPPTLAANEAILCYEGLDSVVRQTRIQFSLPPSKLSDERAVFEIDLDPQEEKSVDSRVSCQVGKRLIAPQSFSGAFDAVQAADEDYRRGRTELETSNPQFNDWIRQSRADLHLLLSPTAKGPYPYAGIPWFSCIFGRDGIITALETLWIQPEIARAVLLYLADQQANTLIASQDAEPGKILHEERKGEMVALHEVPFGCYYGSIDSTPLWLILAGHYYERTADKDLLRQIWPNIQQALTWIDRYGDCDSDGFVEYRQQAAGGLVNQGWKDSEDSVFHADGSLPEAPIALCEVQGYVYEAKLRVAQVADALGYGDAAAELRQAAERLKKRFHEAFWCESLQSFAIALDGHKQPCRIRSSNAGQCLFTGIATEQAANRIKQGLMSNAFFSGWGIRTVSTAEPRYNPMSYHNGSIWPHDNALIAYGLARYGFKEAALRVLNALFDASQAMDLNRLPELYCGFSRRRGEGPTLYPVACNPQAWSSAAVFLALQASLGVRIDAAKGRVYFDNPHLPDTIPELKIRDLKLASGQVDILIVRHDTDVALSITRRTGQVEVIVTH
jgi:glycogen debranching enzyme